jgi:pimeloyl-ACP methyl ester carboxylesterase
MGGARVRALHDPVGSRRARVVLFDRRGSGLSDRSAVTTDELRLPRLASDVLAVLDASGSDQAVLIGASLGGATAVQFAFEHPSRTSALALIATSPRLTKAPGYDVGVDPSDVEGWIGSAVATWGSGGSIEAEGPSMAGNVRHRDWAARVERHTNSPDGAAMILRASLGYDVRALLPGIAVPTLVVHRRDDPGAPVEHSRHLAAHIPGARYVELPGEEHTYFSGRSRCHPRRHPRVHR